ncbi:MAG: TlpA family protein disulfide reductase [Phycisphaerales bacterium]
MTFLRTLALTAAATLAGAPHALPHQPEVRLEGRGDARAKIDAIQNKPFDAALLGRLSDWKGEPISAESMKGKVVVFVTWASWYKTSLEALKVAQRVADSGAGRGVIVVGVHHTKGYEKAEEAARAAGATFAFALDADNEFRKALFSTQDPDFYIVDRAGNLRYADVETSSVEDAAAFLAEETPEAAAAVKPEAKPEVKPSGGGPANYKQPDAAAYAAAKWPAHNKGGLSAADFQGKPLPRPLGKEKYLDGQTPDRTGKVTVIDFWATWCGPCIRAMPKMEAIHKSNKDVVVIGISDEAENTVKTFLKKHNHGYAQAIDQTRSVSGAMKIQGIPHVLVLSSDGVIRWQGNPLADDFERVVKSVAEADPGVKARRAAEGK